LKAKEKQLKHFDNTFKAISQQFEKLGALKQKYEKDIETHKTKISTLEMIVNQKDSKIKELVNHINSDGSTEASVIVKTEEVKKISNEQESYIEKENLVQTLSHIDIQPEPQRNYDKITDTNSAQDDIFEDDDAKEEEIATKENEIATKENQDDTLELIEKYESILAEKELEIEELKEAASNSTPQDPEVKDPNATKTANEMFIEQLEMIEQYESEIEKFKDIISRKDVAITNLKSMLPEESLEELGEQNAKQVEMIEKYEDDISNYEIQLVTLSGDMEIFLKEKEAWTLKEKELVEEIES